MAELLADRLTNGGVLVIKDTLAASGSFVLALLLRKAIHDGSKVRSCAGWTPAAAQGSPRGIMPSQQLLHLTTSRCVFAAGLGAGGANLLAPPAGPPKASALLFFLSQSGINPIPDIHARDTHANLSVSYSACGTVLSPSPVSHWRSACDPG